MRRMTAALLACAALGAHANTITPDFTDLWWNSSESGWGVNVVQQEDTLFTTLFVYGADGSPTWYVGSDVIYAGVQAGQHVFHGPLYRATGPHFAVPFQTSQVRLAQVGTVTFRAAQATTATLSYTVDGVTITRSIARQTWRSQNFSGEYRGAMVGSYSGCNTGNGPFESAAVFTVTQQGFAITIRQDGAANSCSYSGAYSPAGTIGVVEGASSCGDGLAQSFSVTEMKVGIDFFSGAMTGRGAGTCAFAGRIGGVRRN